MTKAKATKLDKEIKEALFDPNKSKQRQFEKQCKAKAHEGKKLKGQQTLTSAVSTSKRLSEFAFDIKGIVEKAKSFFGVTKNPYEAGYIMPDGSMLDLSGRHYASGYSHGKPLPGKPDYLRNQRSVDHREVAEVIGKGGTAGMLMFMKETGAIRLAVLGTDINIALFNSLKPTLQQKKTLGNIINYTGGTILYDRWDEKGDTIKSGEVSSAKLFDIKGIADSLRRQGIEPDLIDIEGEYDHNLSHSENLAHFKDMLGLGGRRKQGEYETMAEQFYKAQAMGTGRLAYASPQERAAAFARMRETGTLRGYDLKTSSVPSRWYEAMVRGIKKSSDVRNPYAIVKSIWAKLSPSKKAEIKAREAKGEHFKYNLPLPVDKPTKGTGTVRMVKPFKLAEVQVNLSVRDYLTALQSGIFSKMKRDDGTTALVARCKSPEKNVNIFVDKAGK